MKNKSKTNTHEIKQTKTYENENKTNMNTNISNIKNKFIKKEEKPSTPIKMKIKRYENKIQAQNKINTPTKQIKNTNKTNMKNEQNKLKQRKQMEEDRRQKRITNFFSKRDTQNDKSLDLSAPHSQPCPIVTLEPCLQGEIQAQKQGFLKGSTF